MRTSLYAGLAGTVILGLTALSAFAQETTEDAPFNGLYVGAAGGYDVQPNDAGSSILFDRNLDGRFGDAVTTAAGANAFSSGFCNGATTATTLTGGRGCRKD